MTYFDAWKQIPPAFPGGPGLRQPRCVRVEYLQADFAATEKEVAKKPVTDQEIKKYYDDHHEEYRNHPAATSTPTSPTGPTLSLPGATKAPAGRPTPVQKNAAPGKNGASPPAKSDPKDRSQTELQIGEPPETTASRCGRRSRKAKCSRWADWRAEPIQLAAADDIQEPSAAPALPQPPAAKSGTTQSGTTQSGMTPTAKQPPTTKPAGAKPTATKPTDANSIFSSTTKTPEGPEPEFRPLDEILKHEIRDQIPSARGRKPR